MKFYCSFCSCDRVFEMLNTELLFVLCVFLSVQTAHYSNKLIKTNTLLVFNEWDSRLRRQVETTRHIMSLKVSGAIYSRLLITQLVHRARVCWCHLSAQRWRLSSTSKRFHARRGKEGDNHGSFIYTNGRNFYSSKNTATWFIYKKKLWMSKKGKFNVAALEKVL